MIEIRAEEGAPVAEADSGHNSEQTRAIASALAEAARLLNYATMPEKRGLRFPSDVYSVLGELSSVAGLLPQALDQMARWVRAEADAGHARENPAYGPFGGDTDTAAVALVSVARDAAQAAYRLQGLLSEGQSAVRGMESVRSGEGDG